MEFEYELVSENEISNISKLCANVSDNFRGSIDMNPRFEHEIDNLYKKTILNFAKTTICMFNIKYMEMFEFLAKDPNDEIVEFSDTLLGYINSFFNNLERNINVTTENDLEELRYILEISLIMMEGVIEDNDIELAYESFFQIERRIKKEKLYDNVGIFEFEKTANVIAHLGRRINESKVEPSELILANYGNGEEYEISNY